MEFLKTISAVVGFVIVYCFVDWFCGVTAPVLGPVILASMILGLFWLLVRIYKATK